MIARLLPVRLDNEYRGAAAALWLFGLVVAARSAQSVLVLLGGAAVIRSADGVPLETFTPAAAQTVVALSALAAMSRLFLFALCLIALIRYRTAIPLLFVVLLLTMAAGQGILAAMPIPRVGSPPGPFVNLILSGLLILGLALSLRGEAKHTA